jgi:hypothetical protein
LTPRSASGRAFPSPQRQVELPLVGEAADRRRDPAEDPPEEGLGNRDRDPALELLLRAVATPRLEDQRGLPAEEKALRGARGDQVELVGPTVGEELLPLAQGAVEVVRQQQAAEEEGDQGPGGDHDQPDEQPGAGQGEDDPGDRERDSDPDAYDEDETQRPMRRSRSAEA